MNSIATVLGCFISFITWHICKFIIVSSVLALICFVLCLVSGLVVVLANYIDGFPSFSEKPSFGTIVAAQDALDAQDVCSICHESLQQMCSLKLKCAHVFHINCAQRWYAINPTCAMCRTPS